MLAGEKAVAYELGIVRWRGVDDFKYLPGAHQIEHLLHGRSGIHQAHHAIPAAGQNVDCEQRAQAGAIDECRLR